MFGIPDEPAASAGERMLTAEIGCFPVIDQAGNLAGIVTEEDFFRRATGTWLPPAARITRPECGTSTSHVSYWRQLESGSFHTAGIVHGLKPWNRRHPDCSSVLHANLPRRSCTHGHVARIDRLDSG